MAFVKLDTGILNSTLWFERECREVFITALLMAEPRELHEPAAQYDARSLTTTGWFVPPGWYGFVDAAGVGIIARAMVDRERGLAALEQLGAPEETTRSADFEGRRLVRVDGGYIVLNFMKYRDRDYTAAERSKRYRLRQKQKSEAVASRRDITPLHRDITQAEAEAEAEIEKKVVDQPAADRPSATSGWMEKSRVKVELGPGWELPEAWGVDAERLGWKAGGILKEAERFRQYWNSGRGAGTRRTPRGWRQAWSNWLTKAERMAA